MICSKHAHLSLVDASAWILIKAYTTIKSCSQRRPVYASLRLLFQELLLLQFKAHYQAFFWVLIDLIVELLGLIIKPFDNQTES
jgi:hypothetical protein